MNVDLLRHQQRWKDGLQDLRTGFATLEAQVSTSFKTVCVCTGGFHVSVTDLHTFGDEFCGYSHCTYAFKLKFSCLES